MTPVASKSVVDGEGQIAGATPSGSGSREPSPAVSAADAASIPSADDGWIDWSGGECPTPYDARVVYRLRNNDRCIPQRASQLDWSHNGAWNDIVAYRVVSA